MSEGKTFYELMKEHWDDSRRKNLRHIIYSIGNEKREGYVEVDDLEARFIPIRDSELCGSVVGYVNQDFIREYTLRHLDKKEQENWDITVTYEAQSGGAV